MIQSGVKQEVHNSILPTDHIQLRTQAAELMRIDPTAVSKKVRDTPAINGEFVLHLQKFLLAFYFVLSFPEKWITLCIQVIVESRVGISYPFSEQNSIFMCSLSTKLQKNCQIIHVDTK